jgi:hypothetical protein
MPNDLTLLVYIDQAKHELTKGERWMSISPRLALETFQELLAERQHRKDALAPKPSLSIARRNEDTQK